jgi:hypothetical protein
MVACRSALAPNDYRAIATSSQEETPMLIEIVVVLLVAAAALAAFIASRPADFRVSRSRRLSAPPDVVYGCVSDLRRWPEWSPFEKVDPNLEREFSGPRAGTGASYGWSGNSQVGEGRMTITDTAPGRRVTLRLEFLRPFVATHTAQFELAPSGTGTSMTWTMTGRNGFMGKAIGLVMNTDRMCGGLFEQGLATLDGLTAAPSTGRTAATA